MTTNIKFTPAIDTLPGWFSSGPSAMHNIISAYPRRYALHLKGFDEDGKPRALVLTWDGEWHPCNPTTGNIMKRADQFAPEECGRWCDRPVRRIGGAILMSNPAKTTWAIDHEDGTSTRIYIFADDLVEVLP